MTDEELHNFGPFRAKIAIYLANFNNFWAVGWTLIIPEPISEISRQTRKESRESRKRFKIENESRYKIDDLEIDDTKTKQDLRICWCFMAKQIDMTVYYVSTVVILCSAVAALSPIWVAYSFKNNHFSSV